VTVATTVLVERLITETVVAPEFATIAVLPSGVIATAFGADPTSIGVPTDPPGTVSGLTQSADWFVTIAPQLEVLDAPASPSALGAATSIEPVAVAPTRTAKIRRAR